jgi:hypothetical protein
MMHTAGAEQQSDASADLGSFVDVLQQWRGGEGSMLAPRAWRAMLASGVPLEGWLVGRIRARS